MTTAGVFTVVVQRTRVDEPWGLRLRGGTDCQQPLSVYKVRRRRAAERAGVEVGDLVLGIDDIVAGHLTHQQVLDLVSQQHQQLALKLTLSRRGAVMLASSERRQAHSDARASSPGLLAFIPFSVQQNASAGAGTHLPQLMMSSWHADDNLSSSRSGSSEASHRAPRNKVPSHHHQQVKSYQPLDMTGRNSFYSSPARISQIPAREYNPGRSSLDPSDIGSSYSTLPPSTVSSPSDAATEQSWRPSTSAYYIDDQSTLSLSTAQSRSFLLLEAALQAQGTGAVNAGSSPPPAHAL